MLSRKHSNSSTIQAIAPKVQPVAEPVHTYTYNICCLDFSSVPDACCLLKHNPSAKLSVFLPISGFFESSMAGTTYVLGGFWSLLVGFTMERPCHAISMPLVVQGK